MNRLSIILIVLIVILATALGIVSYNYSVQKDIAAADLQVILKNADSNYELHKKIDELEKRLEEEV